MNEDINNYQKHHFMIHIISEICSYAQANGCSSTEMIEEIGEDFVEMAKTIDFDNCGENF